ncbi:SHOCT domain-containing protein [Actinoplanes teichomyceticus]|uniref:Putative membrane protein n=1 Tax=Actinoplanes teichomyceticus TaxID=1867 RepID=A0A561VI84_ACTTI|nr:SHOCT domain-containing protein [Actinoplanes teichomyceticus]TWG11328.1 putative membrane protein [Actinoplanes teichomyceticus]GIF16360.1 hypothetical protein Ate01nite_63920 [Actinoplanes teichomyceticus]
MMYDHPHLTASGSAWLLVVLALLLVSALVAAVIRRPAHRDHGAEKVLADRFARGEIDAEEYEQCLHTLRAAGR